MPLTDEQRAELAALGADNVRTKLIQPGAGRGAALSGFKTGILGGQLTRGDVEDWLAEQAQKETAQQQATIRATLRWARIGGLAGIVSVVIAGAGIWIDRPTISAWVEKLLAYVRH